MLEIIPNQGVKPGDQALLTLSTDHAWLEGRRQQGCSLMTVDTSVSGIVITVNADPPQRHLGVTEGLCGAALARLAASEDRTHVPGHPRKGLWSEARHLM